jgi:hypothetical protein
MPLENPRRGFSTNQQSAGLLILLSCAIGAKGFRDLRITPRALPLTRELLKKFDRNF